MRLLILDVAIGAVPLAAIALAGRRRRAVAPRTRGFGLLLVAVPLPLAVGLHLAVSLPTEADQAAFVGGVVAFTVGAILVLSDDDADGSVAVDEAPPWWPAFERDFRRYDSSRRRPRVHA